MKAKVKRFLKLTVDTELRTYPVRLVKIRYGTCDGEDFGRVV